MGNYVSLVLNILLALFIVAGVVCGLIRGLRKTASRGIFLVLTSIILLFVSAPITNAILKIKINVDFTIEESTLVGYHSINDCVTFFVKVLLGEEFSIQNPEFVNVITSLPLLVLNVFVYLILFIVCKYLLLPLDYLFYKLTFAPKKKKANLAFSSFNNEFDDDSVESLHEIMNKSNEENSTLNTDITVEDEVPITIDPFAQVHSEDIGESENSVEEVQSEGVDAYSDSPSDGGVVFVKKDTDYQTQGEPVIKENFDKPSERELKRANKKQKVNKHRWWGALVGAFVGMFVMMNVCMPIYGIMDIADELNGVKIKNMSDSEISLSGLTDGNADQIIDNYDSSIFYPISKYLGIEGVSVAEFNYLTTKKVNGKKIALKGDIKNIVTTISKADDLVGVYKEYTSSGSITTLNQSQISTLISGSKDLLDFARKVGLVDCVGDYIIPVVCTVLINNGTKFSENELVNKMAINAISALAEESGINVFDETYNILDLVEYLNEQGLLTRILQNDFSDPITIIQNLDGDFGEQFTTKLTKLQTVNITMPYLLNIGLNVLENSINYGYVENEYSISREDLTNAFSNVVRNAINVLNSVDKSSNIYLTTKSLEPIGNLMQTVKVSGIVNEQTYTNLIDFAIEKLQSVLAGLLPKEMESYLLDEFVTNLSKVDRWDEEMKKISRAVYKLRDGENGILGEKIKGEALRQGTSINLDMKEETFENLGEALDILEGTVLFGAVTTKEIDDEKYQVSGTISMFLSLLDYAEETIKKDISNISYHKITSVFDDVKNNLITSKHTYDVENKFWESEMTDISSLAIEIYGVLKSGNFEVTEELGKGLDKAKYSILFGNDATIQLMLSALDIVQDGILGEDFEEKYNDGSDTSQNQVLNDKIYELFLEVKDNLKSEYIKESVKKISTFWQNELKYYKNLKNVADKSSKLNTVDDAKSIAPDLDNLYYSLTIPQRELYNIIAFAIDGIKNENATGDVDKAINRVISNISSRLQSEEYIASITDFEDFWTIEFDHLASLMDIKFGDEGDYKIKDNLSSIGESLDMVVFGYEIKDNPMTEEIESGSVRKSYLLLANDLRDVLASAMDEVKVSISSSFDDKVKTYIESAIDDIKLNVENTKDIPIVSFQKEMTHMQTLANLKIDSSMLVYPTGTDLEITAKLAENATKLDALGRELDSIAFAYQKQGSIYKYTDKINANNTTNSSFVTRQIINNLISGIFDIAKVETAGFPSTQEEMSNEQKEKTAFNNLIAEIQGNIKKTSDNDKVMSWQRELSYVNSLIELNNGKEYDVDNVADNVGKNLDAIAFNVMADNANKFDDIKYTDNGCEYIPQVSDGKFGGNSLFITRSAIKTLMSSYLSRVKETFDGNEDDIEIEQKTLVNDIIDNSTRVIAETDENISGKYYKNTSTCLSQMSKIKKDIDEKIELFERGSSALTEENSLEIDELLEDFQGDPIVGISLTRRVALLILKKMDAPTKPIGIDNIDNAITYYNGLISFYTSRNTSDYNNVLEHYKTSETISEEYYPNPFVTLYKKINNIL